MKKLITIFLAVMLTFGCGKSFKKVQCVEYTIGGSKTTIYSVMKLELDVFIESSYEEYNNAPLKNKSYSGTTVIINIEQDNIFEKGEYIYVADINYYKIEILSVELQYVSVKIKNNNKIEIKTYNNEISTISTDSYQITYFK